MGELLQVDHWSPRTFPSDLNGQSVPALCANLIMDVLFSLGSDGVECHFNLVIRRKESLASQCLE